MSARQHRETGTAFRAYRMAAVIVLWVGAICGEMWLGLVGYASGESLSLDALHPGVCIDAGHGGPTAGKLEPPDCNGDGRGTKGFINQFTPQGDSIFVTEAWVNHMIAAVAKNLIEACPTYTRSTHPYLTDSTLSPSQRALVANLDPDVDLLISVHHEGDLRVWETRTWINTTASTDWRYKLAVALGEEIDRQFHYGFEPMYGTGYDLLDGARMPAVISEASCIGHPEEAVLMAQEDPAHRDAEAAGIYWGYRAYADTFTVPDTLICHNMCKVEQVWFQWPAVPGASGYALYYPVCDGSCPPQEFNTYYLVEDGTFKIIPYAALYPSLRCFSVRAYVLGSNGHLYVGGFSPWLPPAKCFPCSIEREIRNFTATGGYQEVTLTWDAISFESYATFQIWRSNDGGQSYLDSLTEVQFYPDIESYSFVDNTVQYDKDYYYEILDTEWYDWHGPVDASPGGLSHAPVPSPAPVLRVTGLGDDHIHLCLEQGSQWADYYRIPWRPEGGTWTNMYQSGEACFERLDLQNSLAYCFKARGENYAGASNYSAEVCAVPMTKACNLNAQAGNQSARLWWDGDPSASGFEVHYSSGAVRDSVDVGDTTEATLTGLANGSVYNLYVVAYDRFGNDVDPSDTAQCRPDELASVGGDSPQPTCFALGQNHPNPFCLWTAVPYQLAKACTRVRLTVYDAAGREIRRLADGGQPARQYEVAWDGKDGRGQNVPPGVYFCRLEAGSFSKTMKMLRMK